MSHAIDSGSVEFAEGIRTQIVRIGAQWDWQRPWWKSNEMQLGGYWNLSAGSWRQNRFHNVIGETRDITDIGLTPVFRLQANNRIGWYAEARDRHALFAEYL
jgi:lipid A 3-O-deacylase